MKFLATSSLGGFLLLLLSLWGINNRFQLWSLPKGKFLLVTGLTQIFNLQVLDLNRAHKTTAFLAIGKSLSVVLFYQEPDLPQEFLFFFIRTPCSFTSCTIRASRSDFSAGCCTWSEFLIFLAPSSLVDLSICDRSAGCCTWSEFLIFFAPSSLGDLWICDRWW